MEIKVPSFEEEIPLKDIPDIPYFSENYCWHGYDFEKNIGFYSHIGRWSEDRAHLWRESLYIYLPDKTTLSYRGYGVGDCSTGPAGAVQRQVCEVPGQSWHITHHGPARRHHLTELVGGLIPEATPKMLNFSGRFQSDLPVFLYDKSNNTTYGRWHYEQMGQFSGEFEFDGRHYQFDGMAFRDHSRGPRKLTHFIGNNWIQGLLPDGSGFAVFEVWAKNGDVIEKEMSRATLIGRTGIQDAKIIYAPPLDSLDDLLAPIELILDTPQGRLDLKGDPLNTLVYSVDDENNTTSGTARNSMPFVAVEQPVLFKCGDMIVEGHVERCRVLDQYSPALRIIRDSSSSG